MIAVVEWGYRIQGRRISYAETIVVDLSAGAGLVGLRRSLDEALCALINDGLVPALGDSGHLEHANYFLTVALRHASEAADG